MCYLLKWKGKIENFLGFEHQSSSDQGLWEELWNDVFKNHIPSAVRFSLDTIPGQNVKENSRCTSKFLFFSFLFSGEQSSRFLLAMVSCLGVIRFLACVAGIALSVYALHVEISKEHNKEYKALCDINEHMSCSKVFSSKYVTFLVSIFDNFFSVWNSYLTSTMCMTILLEHCVVLFIMESSFGCKFFPPGMELVLA